MDIGQRERRKAPARRVEPINGGAVELLQFDMANTGDDVGAEQGLVSLDCDCRATCRGNVLYPVSCVGLDRLDRGGHIATFGQLSYALG